MPEPLPFPPASGDLVSLKALLLMARDSLVQENPFLGSLALRLPISITEAPDVRTACVDGRGWCHFSRSFLERLSLPEVRCVLLHEVLHLALDVFARGDGRHSRRWNVAHDYAVNALIEESRFPLYFLEWPKGFFSLLDRAFFHLPAEEIYERLSEQSIEHKEVPSDVLMDHWHSLDAETRAETRRRWRERLVQAAEEAMRDGGWNDLPPWAQKLVGPLLAPQVPWQVRLAQKVHGRIVGRRRTYSRPGRRSQALGQILPGVMRDHGVVGVFMDVSGSIQAADLRAFLGELVGILREGDLPVRMLHWDTEVTADRLLQGPDDLRQALEWMPQDIQGGGGTNPFCILEHLSGHGASAFPMPTFGILLTDGYVVWPTLCEWPFELLVVTTGQEPPPTLHYDWVRICTKESP
jgi:predicted metal-dependent peptidase